MGTRRNLVRIDEQKCDGCGQCVLACAEGAIRIIDGKAKLVSETYCDGLGACLGECPQDAITIEQRDADDFDPEAVRQHLQQTGQPPHPAPQHPAHPGGPPTHRPAPAHPHGGLGGCPGSAMRDLRRAAAAPACDDHDGGDRPSRLGNWPVQLSLMPPSAPYLNGAELLIAADCVPFAHADFHRRFLRDRTLAIGCPKLDDAEFYLRKLTQLFKQNDVRSVHVVHMEVPCCFGLVRLVEEALQSAGKPIPLTVTTIGIRGDVLGTRGPEEATRTETGP